MKALVRKPWFAPLVALLLVYGAFSLLSPDTFVGRANLIAMTRQTVVVAIAAIGMTYVIVQGGIDLSVGSLVAFTTVVLAVALRADLSVSSAVLLALFAATAAGALNGLIIARLGVTPFIVTLGTMSALRGAAKGLANEQKVDVDSRGLDEWMLPPENELWLFPPGVWLAIALAVFFAFALKRSVFGRHITAMGSNLETARLCGLPLRRLTLGVYALAGALAGVAGVMEFSTLTVGDPTDSIGLELDVIAAVVIGGGSLAGGTGSILGTVLGALLMTVIKTGATHVGMPNWVQEILTGAIIVVAVAVDRYRR